MKSALPRLPAAGAMLTLCAIPAAAPSAQEPDKPNPAIEEIQVLGRAQTYYRVDDSSLATKTPTSILEIPNSVQVLSHQLIEDQAARRITDLYRSISGVSEFSYSGVTFRGFRQDEVRYNGVSGDPFSGFDIPLLFNIERVEVLKGPAGMLYGGGDPGGLINYVTKQPKPEETAAFTLTAGNYDLYGFTAETTGSLADDETLFFRLGTGYEKQDYFRFNTGRENAQLAGAVTALLGNATEATVEAEYIDQNLRAHRLRGVPVDDDGNFLTDIRFTTNEKTDYQNMDAVVVQGRADHDFGSGLLGNLTLRYLKNTQVQNYHEPRGLLADGRTMRREFRDQHREAEEYSLTGNAVWQADVAGMEHLVLAGGDLSNRLASSNNRTALDSARGGPVPDIDLLEPDYGHTSPVNYGLESITPSINSSRSLTWGLYLQDQVDITEKWLAVLGLRFDRFKDRNRISGQSFTDQALTMRGGLIYKPVEDASVYVSYSESFKPQGLSSQFADNGPFPPEESRQWEGGAKARWLDGAFQTTVSAYQIVKTNVLQSDPSPTAGPNDFVNIGEVTSRGAELDLVGDITDVWTMTASYAYNHTRVTGDAGTNAISNSIGDRFANSPANTLGFWTRYDFPAINAAIAFGMDYVDERISLDGQKVRPHTIFDASLRTAWNGLEFQLNVRNLFDKEYAASGFIERNGHFPGEPRTVVFQISTAL